MENRNRAGQPRVVGAPPPKHLQLSHAVIFPSKDLFQSTPPRGAPCRGTACRALIRGFNPRPRAGGDFDQKTDNKQITVSIHAPAQGATRRDVLSPTKQTSFQSTPPRRGRLTIPAAADAQLSFQSTPPRRGRLTFGAWAQLGDAFQSTPPRRGRHVDHWHLATVELQFQSTPPRRGRPT